MSFSATANNYFLWEFNNKDSFSDDLVDFHSSGTIHGVEELENFLFVVLDQIKNEEWIPLDSSTYVD